MIESKRVRVNGQVATLGTKADRQNDNITVDGEPIPRPEPLKYVALHKPPGVLSTVKSPDERPTVRDYVHVSGRLYPVGRLDVDSEGLILMTNDGKLTNRLTHPRYEHEKEYRVYVREHPGPDQLKTWQEGVLLQDGYRTQPAGIEVESHEEGGTWLRVTLREGKKRQIRRMADQTGLTVERIIRVRIADLRLGDLPAGEWRHLTEQEIQKLKA